VESGNPTSGTGYYVFVRCEGLVLIMINACKHFRMMYLFVFRLRI
jgi:hypothetical protein